MASKTISIKDLSDVLHTRFMDAANTLDAQDAVEAIAIKLDEIFFKEGKIDKRNDFLKMCDIPYIQLF